MGTARDSSNTYVAMIWDAHNGMRSLQSVLGSSATWGWTLSDAMAVSDDGLTQVTGFPTTGDIVGLDGIHTGAHQNEAIALEDCEPPTQ